MIITKKVQLSLWLNFFTAVLLVLSEEIGVDSQSLTLKPATNSTNGELANQTSIVDASSNKFLSLNNFRPQDQLSPPFRGPPNPQLYNRQQQPHRMFNVPQHYHHHHNHPPPNSPHFYRPLIPLDPLQIDHYANASKLIVGELVNSFGQAFQSLLSQRMRSPDGQVRLLNGESIIATASQLLPSASKLLARSAHSEVRLSSASHITEAKVKPATNETSSVSQVDELQQPNGDDSINYDVKGQKLREDIVNKVGHLQTVLTTAIEVSKERRDIITRRILEQTNYRLEQAKERADRILSEPQNSQMVLRTLHTINQGINGIHSFLHGLLDRINISINVKLADPGHKTDEKTNTTKKSTKSNEMNKEANKTVENK